MAEFWRVLKPIEGVFKKDAAPEVYLEDTPTDAYESDEPMKVHFNVTGPLVWLDENGEAEGFFDVHDYKLFR